MRAYVLVEGTQTEPRVYRRWLPMMFPGLQEVDRIEDMADNRFFLVPGYGYPSYLKRLEDAVADINDEPGRFDCLLICVDTESRPYDEVSLELRETISQQSCPVPHHFLIADCCIEAWFLGSLTFMPRQPGADLQPFYDHHPVREADPEEMAGMGDWLPAETCLRYFKAACRQRNTVYSKRAPGPVLEQPFVKQLIHRTQTTPHLQSFAEAVAHLRARGGVL